jgi:hypothetical protein
MRLWHGGLNFGNLFLEAIWGKPAVVINGETISSSELKARLANMRKMLTRQYDTDVFAGERGHTIPEGVVRRRFHKGVNNFIKIYRPLLDSWFIIDNSRETSQMIAFERDGVRKVIAPEIFAKIFQGKGEI